MTCGLGLTRSVVLNGLEVPSGALAVGSPAVVKPGRARPEDVLEAAESYVRNGARYRTELRRIDRGG